MTPTPSALAGSTPTIDVRCEVVIDRSALRSNVRRLRDALAGSELWAVVKADAYGHGADTVAPIMLDEGATALCVATVGEGIALRSSCPTARVIVLGPAPDSDIARAREARLELVIVDGRVPQGIAAHLKIDTGLGRWGLEAVAATNRDVVGLMSHLAVADSDAAFTAGQIARFDEIAGRHPRLARHIANSAATLRIPAARFDAGRPGIALYGLSPFNSNPANDGLRPVLQWRSQLAQVKLLRSGQSTGYGRGFVAERATWIGVVPVGYADGFRRALTDAEVLVDGTRRRVVGVVSMDCFAVELDRNLPRGTPVTLIGDGLLAEEHARRLGTITHELVCGINSDPDRVRRVVIGR